MRLNITFVFQLINLVITIVLMRRIFWDKILPILHAEREVAAQKEQLSADAARDVLAQQKQRDEAFVAFRQGISLVDDEPIIPLDGALTKVNLSADDTKKITQSVVAPEKIEAMIIEKVSKEYQ